MAENNLFSAERHEWARVNRAVKSDANMKTYLNSDSRIATAYQGLIDVFETWRVDVFGVVSGVEGIGGKIIGRPNMIFPCTYQEWAGVLPFDKYLDDAGHKKPVYKKIVAPVAKAFRKAVSDAIHARRAAANINRTDKVNARPGEGVNA